VPTEAATIQPPTTHNPAVVNRRRAQCHNVEMMR
jgi:hypothetical protein